MDIFGPINLKLDTVQHVHSLHCIAMHIYLCAPDCSYVQYEMYMLLYLV